MKSNKIILLVALISLTGCALQNNSSISEKISSTNSSVVSTSKIESSSDTNSSSKNSSSQLTSESSKESSSVSTSEDNSEKTLVIDCTNFNTLDCIDLDGVVENEEYKDKEFTFNSNATLKSKEIKGIKEIIISIYQTYDNLDLFTNYNGTGSAASENKKEGNKELTYTYSFDGINEFCIKNTCVL